MKTHSKNLFAGVAAAAFFAAAVAALARDPVGTPFSGPRGADSLSMPVAQAAPAQAPIPPTAPVDSSDDDADRDTPPSRHHRASRHSDDRVSVLGNDVHVRADEKLNGDAVGVMAGVVVDGTVRGDAVAVMGDNTINGTVDGDAVAVMGDLKLGPKARIGGQVVCIGGQVVRDAGAFVGGQVVEKGLGAHIGAPFRQWWRHGLSRGATLPMGPHFGWLWLLNAFLIGFYALLALVFPGGIRKCGDALVKRPATAILSSFLVLLGLPVLFVLLLITIVGIPVALVVLPLALIVGTLFGRAAIYALIGRSLTRDRFGPALSVIVGALACVLFYLVPILGLVLSVLIAFLGLGCVVTALFASANPPVVPSPVSTPPASAPIPPFPSPDASAVAPAVVGGMAAVGPAAVEAAPATAGTAQPPVLTPRAAAAAQVQVESAAGLPRAGFWIRMAALLIDLILVAVVFVWHAPFILLGLAIYGAILWKLKGSTIGGIILGLKVLRLDDRPIDWGTAFVRAFSCFFSLIVIGFGFIWIAFDREKQAWHDKIAGTVVVRAPKGISLV